MNRDIDFIPGYVGTLHDGSICMSECLWQEREPYHMYVLGTVHPVLFGKGKHNIRVVVDIVCTDGERRSAQVFLKDMKCDT